MNIHDKPIVTIFKVTERAPGFDIQNLVEYAASAVSDEFRIGKLDDSYGTVEWGIDYEQRISELKDEISTLTAQLEAITDSRAQEF